MIRPISISVVLLGLLAGCVDTMGSTDVRDEAGYFDSLTPDPAAFERNRQEELLRQAEAAEVADAPDPAGPVELETEMAAADPNAVPLSADNPTISQTQDFATITERETIESDSEKLAALADTYEVIEPTALPTRKTEVNIAAYAINQTNQVGNRIYIRDSRAQSNCFAFANDPDEAQRVFLERGGPKRDPRNLDVDGDGFACKWNPQNYRKLVQ